MSEAPGTGSGGEEPTASQRDPGVPPRYQHARAIFFSVSAATLVAILFLAQGVLLPFLLAILVAFVLFPAVRWVEKLRMPRWAAILLVYIVMIGSMVGFAVLVVPRLFEETKQLSAELPKLTRTVSEEWLPKIDERLHAWMGSSDEAAAEDTPKTERPAPVVVTPREDGSYEIEIDRPLTIRKRDEDTWVIGPGARERGFSSRHAVRDGFAKAMAFVQKNSLEVLKIGRTIVAGVSRGIFYFFITLMLAGYMMFTYERIHGFIRETVPERRRRALDRFLFRLDRAMSGVVRGQLIICLVNGVLSAIGFWIFDLKYWPILSLIAAAMSIIPIFGSILSTIPAVAIGLTQDLGTAIGVFVWIVAIHQVEANFLNPKIIGDQAKIHPVLVVFALLLGEHLFQIKGALLAVPALAVVQTVFMHFRESVLGLPASRISRTSLMPPGAATVSATGLETPLVATKRSTFTPPADDIGTDPPTEDDGDGNKTKKKRDVSTTLKSELE